MNYAENGYSKLQLFGSHSAVATTGDVLLMARFLEQAKQNGHMFRSDKAVAETARDLEYFLWKLYRELHPEGPKEEGRPATTLLFGGCSEFLGEQRSFLYRVHLQERFLFYEEPVTAVAGQAFHGGLYYLTRFRRDEMTLKEAGFLLYLCTREVAKADPTVSPMGVELILCEPHGARSAPPEWLEYFRVRYENAAHEMRGWFSF
jgi:hypothetical protein